MASLSLGVGCIYDRARIMNALVVALVGIVLASGCAFGARDRHGGQDRERQAGWSTTALPHRPLLPVRWLLRSHTRDGDAIDPLDDLVVALDTNGDGEGDLNVDLHRFEVRYEDPSAQGTIWFRLVPLDVARSRRTLMELGAMYVEQLRTRGALDAAIVALTRGDAVGPMTSGAYIPGTTTGRGNNTTTTAGTFIPEDARGRYPTARVFAEVSVLAAQTRASAERSRQLLVDVAATPDPSTARLREAALAIGDATVPDRARLAVTLVRLPGRFVARNPYGGMEVPVVLLVGYAGPPESFAAGLEDYQALLRRVRVDAE